MTTTTTHKTRTITLTGRPPVQIREADWPIIAEGTGDSYASQDYSRYRQALGQGELDEYSLRVRQHADGRTLVYGVLSGASTWTGTESIRGGVLLPSPAPETPGLWRWTGHIGDAPVVLTIWPGLVEAIQAVGAACHLPDAVIRACVADLPAEVL